MMTQKLSFTLLYKVISKNKSRKMLRDIVFHPISIQENVFGFSVITDIAKRCWKDTSLTFFRLIGYQKPADGFDVSFIDVLMLNLGFTGNTTEKRTADGWGPLCFEFQAF